MTPERRDELADEQADAAAREAGAIGGRPTRDLDQDDAGRDPALDPVSEAGGGEAEGFELAEEQLREHAEQGPAKPEVGVRVRDEVDRLTEEQDPATYGEPDQEDVTEVTRDPSEGRDDAGAGPGVAADR